MSDEELMSASTEERFFWQQCVKGLPGLEGFSGTGKDADGVQIPWGSGPHNLRAFREFVKIVKPQHIFEVGFNLGYSAVVWLNICKATVTSIDISQKEETLVAAKFLKEIYPDRFVFMLGDSYRAWDIIHWQHPKFDMAFIDGSHLEEDVVKDIEVCWKFRIHYLVMDDWLPRFGPGVQAAVAKYPLEVVGVIGNTALVKFKNVWQES